MEFCAFVYAYRDQHKTKTKLPTVFLFMGIHSELLLTWATLVCAGLGVTRTTARPSQPPIDSLVPCSASFLRGRCARVPSVTKKGWIREYGWQSGLQRGRYLREVARKEGCGAWALGASPRWTLQRLLRASCQTWSDPDLCWGT